MWDLPSLLLSLFFPCSNFVVHFYNLHLASQYHLRFKTFSLNKTHKHQVGGLLRQELRHFLGLSHHRCLWGPPFVSVRGEKSSRETEGPVGGVAQVVCHGVIVVVGHQEEGQEEKGEKQGEVEGEVEKLRDNRTSWMVWRWGDKRVNGLEPCGV